MADKKGKIHFFTGKGGVGKTTLSLAFAKARASRGEKTLLIEFSQLNSFSQLLDIETGFQPKKFKKNLDLASWDGEDCLQEFVKYSFKLRLIFETFYKSKAINALIKAAPALKEIAFLGYLTSHFRGVKPELDYDCIIVDAPSTGHFLSCLKVPQALLEISSIGPMGFHCRGIIETLKDSSLTEVHAVFQAEELILKEQAELVSELNLMGIKVTHWLNNVYPQELSLEILSSMESETKDPISSYLSEKAQIERAIIEDKNLKTNIINEIFENNFDSIAEQMSLNAYVQ